MDRETAGQLLQLIEEHISARVSIPDHTDPDFAGRIEAANSAERKLWEFFKTLIE